MKTAVAARRTASAIILSPIMHFLPNTVLSTLGAPSSKHFDFNQFAPGGVDDVDRTGKAGIEAVNCPQDL